ncbi:MAG: glycosyltransferase family 2 protein [Nanoarchaeota archaeon]|nr:glycosyltransferase family 2 protein [Nanoarchaeota archaeon]
MVKISLISPVHNEENAIKELISRVTNVMQANYGNDWEFILVDDFSTDNSAEIIKDIAKKRGNIRYIKLEKKGGQTGCFKAGFDNAKGDVVITMDADLQVLPEDIPLFMEKMENGYDVVNGIREHRKHLFKLRFVSRIYNLLMLLFFNCPVLDAASNYTAVKRKYVEGLDIINNDHRYIIPIVIRRGAKKIGEVVIQHKERHSGKTKYRALHKYVKGGPEIIAAWIRFHRGRYDKVTRKT